MTPKKIALWTVRKEIYDMMNAGEVYTTVSIIELSGCKFSKKQASTNLRNLWAMGLLEITDPPTRPRSYLKLSGMKLEVIYNHYKIIRETE